MDWAVIELLDEEDRRLVSEALDAAIQLSTSVCQYRQVVKDMTSCRSSFHSCKINVMRDDIDGLGKEFGTDNWDGQGAKAMDEGSYKTALRHLDTIAEHLPLPAVTVDVRGKVCLEWGSVYSMYLLIKFGIEGTVSCFGQQDAHSKIFCRKFTSQQEGDECLKQLSCHA